MKRVLPCFLMALFGALAASADEPSLSGWIAIIEGLPTLPAKPEEKLYIIPRNPHLKRGENSVVVTFDVCFVCGFKSKIFLNKPQTQTCTVEMYLNDRGKRLGVELRELDSVHVRREEYVFD